MKLFVKTPSAVCALLAAPAAAVFLALYIGQETPLVIRVGLCGEDGALIGYVSDYIGGYDVIEARVFGGEEELRAAAARFDVLAGYYFKDGADKLAEGSVTVYTPAGSPADTFVNELITSALLYNAAPDVTAAELSKIYKTGEAAVKAYAEKAVRDYQSREDIFVKGIFTYASTGIDGEANDNAAQIPRRVIDGAASVLLLLAAISARSLAPPFGFGKGLAAARLSGFASRFLLILTAGFAAAAASGAGALTVCAYSLNVCAFGELFKIGKKDEGAKFAATALVIIISLTMGGAVVDITEFLPQEGIYAHISKACALLPTALYHNAGAPALAAEAAAFGAFAAVVSNLKRLADRIPV